MCSPEIMTKVKDHLSRRSFLGMVGVAALGAPAAKLMGQPQRVHRLATTGKVADLTHVFRPDFPTFNGLPAMEITPLVTVKKDGFYINQLSYPEHSGTHMDAPAHFVDGATTADNMPVEQLVAPIAVIDISARAAKDADSVLTVDDVLAWEKANGKLPAGVFVAMNSGWDSRVLSSKDYRNADDKGVMHFPGFSGEVSEFLIKERDIVGIGVDTLSIDFGPSADFKTHITILSAGKFGVENLANLGALPATGATIVVGGPKHKDASGGPTRAIALY
jgi:kynurenine formamidase